MKHFIGTRFNLKAEEWTNAKDGSIVLTNDWLDERFILFQKFCFPSVINQTNKNFLWVIFFDIDTPQKYRNSIESITANYKNIKVLYIDGLKSINQSFKAFICCNIDDNDEYVITTRLDNDDSIHKNFVSTIQRLAIKKHETIIDLRKGFQMDVTKDEYECRVLDSVFNPYISLVEKSSLVNTVFSRNHNHWGILDSIVVYDASALWIEIVHKRNKLNQTRIDIPLIFKIKLKDFGITEEMKNKKLLLVMINNFKFKYKKLTVYKKIREFIKALLK